MPKTAIADVIVPVQFERYAVERTTELASFYQSGIVLRDEAFDELAAAGGRDSRGCDRDGRAPRKGGRVARRNRRVACATQVSLLVVPLGIQGARERKRTGFGHWACSNKENLRPRVKAPVF